jgi:hypothetical protein
MSSTNTLIQSVKSSRDPSASPLIRCAAILLLFGLLIGNWRSPLGIYFAKSDLNRWVFYAVISATPVALFIVARALTPVLRWLMRIVAAALALFAILVCLVVLIAGVDIDSFIQSIPGHTDRIAAYQVETPYSGYVIRLRLERTLLPGFLLGRDIAYVNALDLDTLVLQSPNAVCLSFHSSVPNLAGLTKELETTLTVQPLIVWTGPVRIDDHSATPVAGGQPCSRAVNHAFH